MTDKEVIKQARKAFEVWISNFDMGVDLSVDADGYYDDFDVQRAWAGWQAALTCRAALAEQEQALQAANGGIDENTSDGYHTFKELYAFRKAYNAALFNEWAASGKCAVHKSWRHHDGELCFGGGWFIVVAVLPNGQISNHYKASDWDLFDVPETDTALLEFDGHTGTDVIERLCSYTPQPAPQPKQDSEPVAKAWDEGYRQGVADERTSEATIGIAGFGMKVEPARVNPYRVDAPQPAPVVPQTPEQALQTLTDIHQEIEATAVQQGWKLVPVELTEKMIGAGINTPVADSGDDSVDRPEDYKAVYRAMLAAAPEAPAVQRLTDTQIMEFAQSHGLNPDAALCFWRDCDAATPADHGITPGANNA